MIIECTLGTNLYLTTVWLHQQKKQSRPPPTNFLLTSQANTAPQRSGKCQSAQKKSTRLHSRKQLDWPQAAWSSCTACTQLKVAFAAFLQRMLQGPQPHGQWCSGKWASQQNKTILNRISSKKKKEYSLRCSIIDMIILYYCSDLIALAEQSDGTHQLRLN